MISESIKTHQLELFNKQGQRVLKMDTSDDGKPIIEMFGADQCARMLLWLDDQDRPQISLLAPNGVTVVGIGISDSPLGSGVMVMDSEGKNAATLALTPDGTVHCGELP